MDTNFNSNYGSTNYQQLEAQVSMRQINDSINQKPLKPNRFGLNQIRDNMQDPVRLAVKEVLKAEREKSQNV